MKLLLAVLLWAIPAQAIPVLIHSTTNPSTEGNVVTRYTARLPVPILSGNAGIAFVNNSAGASPTNCTDDGGTGVPSSGTAWTSAVTEDDTNQRVAIYYRLNITDGSRMLSCNFVGRQYVTVNISEWSGIATASAVDTTCTGKYTAASTNLDCSANMTFAATGNLVVAFGTQTGVITTVGPWTAGTSFVRMGWDVLDSTFLEYLVYNSTTAFKPFFTTDVNMNVRPGLMVAVGFKAAAAGTLPTGMTPVNVYHGRHGAADAGPTWQFPCRGDENLITIIWNGAAGKSADAVADTNITGTWAQAGAGSVFGGSGKNQHWYVPNATCTDLGTITVTFSGGSEPDSEFMIISWINAATAPLDTAATTTNVGTGTSSTTGTDATGMPFTGAASTPSTTSGWIISYLGSNTGLGSESQGSPGYFISPDTEPVITTSPVGENQGAVLYPNVAVAVYTVTWTPNLIAVGTWADYQSTWLAAGAPLAGGTGRLSTLGAGK